MIFSRVSNPGSDSSLADLTPDRRSGEVPYQCLPAERSKFQQKIGARALPFYYSVSYLIVVDSFFLFIIVSTIHPGKVHFHSLRISLTSHTRFSYNLSAKFNSNHTCESPTGRIAQRTNAEAMNQDRHQTIQEMIPTPL